MCVRISVTVYTAKRHIHTSDGWGQYEHRRGDTPLRGVSPSTGRNVNEGWLRWKEYRRGRPTTTAAGPRLPISARSNFGQAADREGVVPEWGVAGYTNINEELHRFAAYPHPGGTQTHAHG